MATKLTAKREETALLLRIRKIADDGGMCKEGSCGDARCSALKQIRGIVKRYEREARS